MTSIYVASSWRNPYQPDIVNALQRDGHTVYDFRHPPGGEHLGFSWSDVDPDWEQWTIERYMLALVHPIAQAGFDSDYDAMRAADVCVLVLPCGRSAHLEAGYFVGAGKPLHIVLDPAEFITPGTVSPHSNIELMYKMATMVWRDRGAFLAGYSFPDAQR